MAEIETYEIKPSSLEYLNGYAVINTCISIFLTNLDSINNLKEDLKAFIKDIVNITLQTDIVITIIEIDNLSFKYNIADKSNIQKLISILKKDLKDNFPHLKDFMVAPPLSIVEGYLETTLKALLETLTAESDHIPKIAPIIRDFVSNNYNQESTLTLDELIEITDETITSLMMSFPNTRGWLTPLLSTPVDQIPSTE